MQVLASTVPVRVQAETFYLMHAQAESEAFYPNLKPRSEAGNGTVDNEACRSAADTEHSQGIHR